jgi:hypothetical protein
VAHRFNHHHFNIFPDGGDIQQGDAKQTRCKPAGRTQPQQVLMTARPA